MTRRQQTLGPAQTTDRNERAAMPLPTDEGGAGGATAIAMARRPGARDVNGCPRFRHRMLTVAAAAVAVDVMTKLAAATWLADRPVRLGRLVSLRLVHNRGVAFGVAAAAPTPAVVAVTAGVAVLIAVLAWRGELGAPVAAGLVVGGAVANVADRLTAGSVVDFLDVGRWPTFNLADVFLVAGIGMLVFTAGTQRPGSDVPTRTTQEA